MNLNPLNLYVHFLSSFDSELGSWFGGAVLRITWSTQSSVLNRNILWPYEPVSEQQKYLFLVSSH